MNWDNHNPKTQNLLIPLAKKKNPISRFMRDPRTTTKHTPYEPNNTQYKRLRDGKGDGEWGAIPEQKKKKKKKKQMSRPEEGGRRVSQVYRGTVGWGGVVGPTVPATWRRLRQCLRVGLGALLLLTLSLLLLALAD